MRGVANVSNFTPRCGIEPLDGVDQPEHPGADEVARVDARRETGADAAGDELDERGVRDDEVVSAPMSCGA